jgi:hypothetical protein
VEVRLPGAIAGVRRWTASDWVCGTRASRRDAVVGRRGQPPGGSRPGVAAHRERC